jgi:transcriptional regulator GlxA family with amidase domain
MPRRAEAAFPYGSSAPDELLPKAGDGPVLSVGFILLPRFTLMAMAGFIEALRHAADIRDRSRQIQCRWSILGPDLQPVRSSCGVAVAPWESFGDDIPFDYIAVVGGLLAGHEAVSPKVLRYIERAAVQGVPLIGLCTGSFLLARAGLMDGRKCCVSYYHVEEFQEEFAGRDIEVVADALFVIDGLRITCAGGLGSVDLAVYLLERHLGLQRARKSMAQMIFDAVRPPTAPQPRFDSGWRAPARNPVVRRAVLLMELHIAEPIAIAGLAEQLGFSLKTLERRFQAEFGISPAAFYKKIRIEIAQRMLMETTRPIMNIALDCGFGDVSYFGRSFRAAFGVSPRDYRRGRGVSSAEDPAGASQEVAE